MVSEILIKTSNLAFNWQFYRECPKVSIIDMNPTITNLGLQPHQPREQCVQLVFRVARLIRPLVVLPVHTHRHELIASENLIFSESDFPVNYAYLCYFAISIIVLQRMLQKSI